MTLDETTRRELTSIAANLRRRAEAARETSWSGPEDHKPISYWDGLHAGLVDAHGLVMAALAEDRALSAPQTPAGSRDDDTRAVIAMYLTPAGAYITVTADGVDEETGQPLYVSANCEACGHLQWGERHAQDHVQTCRRLPERLWPEGGVR